MKTFIYFLLNENTRQTKIGCSKEPYKRMANVKYDRGNDRTHTYKPLFIAQGSFETEAEIHTALKKYHSRGEWFVLSKRTIYRIAAIFKLFLQ